jgi:hypothetical protein
VKTVVLDPGASETRIGLPGNGKVLVLPGKAGFGVDRKGRLRAGDPLRGPWDGRSVRMRLFWGGLPVSLPATKGFLAEVLRRLGIRSRVRLLVVARDDLEPMEDRVLTSYLVGGRVREVRRVSLARALAEAGGQDSMQPSLLFCVGYSYAYAACLAQEGVTAARTSPLGGARLLAILRKALVQTEGVKVYEAELAPRLAAVLSDGSAGGGPLTAFSTRSGKRREVEVPLGLVEEARSAYLEEFKGFLADFLGSVPIRALEEALAHPAVTAGGSSGSWLHVALKEMAGLACATARGGRLALVEAAQRMA